MIALRQRWARLRGTEDFAWACFVANLLGVPGLGTLMAGRWEAFPQIGLSLAGGVLLTWFLVRFVVVQLQAITLSPADGVDLRLALWGSALFGLAWLWGLASGAAVLRQARGARATDRSTDREA